MNGEVLLNYSGGFADIANEIPNTFETNRSQLQDQTCSVITEIILSCDNQQDNSAN